MPSRSRASFRSLAARGFLVVWGMPWLAVGCEAQLEVVEVALELRAPPGCELPAPMRFELRALGDFRTQREEFELGGAAPAFDRFPIGTRELAIEGRFEGETVATGRTRVTLPTEGAGAREPVPIVLLPERESCPLGDPVLFPGEGAAVAPLPGGGFLMAGGTGVDGRVRSSAVVLRAGRTLIEEVGEGMLLRRRDASATLAGDFIVVAGGARELRGEAEENYEVYDVQRGVFAGERSDQLSSGPRMEHGAALLPDGSVLLAGGRTEPGGAPIASAELIGLVAPASEQPSELNTARIAPQVLALDSGAVVVAGGRDAQGVIVTTLERFEAAARRFVTLELQLPVFEHAVAVALPGGRIGWFGCDTRSRAACGLTLVLLRGDEPIAIEVPLAWSESLPRGLVELRSIALEDGRLLVTGRDPAGAMTSRALVVDLGARTLEAVPATRAPTILLLLEDGAIAELDSIGVSLRRIGSVSTYDSPEGNLLRDARPSVVVDAPERWEQSDDGLRALVSGARVDVPRVSFGRFRTELALRGATLLRLRAADAPELAIRLGGREAAAEGCEASPADGRFVLERGAKSVRISTSGGARSCELTWPAREPATLAVEAEADTLLRELRLERL